MSWFEFHANFYAFPPDLQRGDEATLHGLSIHPLQQGGRPGITFSAFFDRSFEETMAALQMLPGVDAEPDGFFVISGFEGSQRWRLSGHLYDFDERLHRMELHGACPADVIEKLWRCTGWPATQVACELLRDGVVLEAEDFRRVAVATSSQQEGV